MGNTIARNTANLCEISTNIPAPRAIGNHDSNIVVHTWKSRKRCPGKSTDGYTLASMGKYFGKFTADINCAVRGSGYSINPAISTPDGLCGSVGNFGYDWLYIKWRVGNLR